MVLADTDEMRTSTNPSLSCIFVSTKTLHDINYLPYPVDEINQAILNNM